MERRIIKRYESRKLYDTGDSRYVSLEDLAELIRAGEELQVVDNATSEDVTAQTLTQIILEEGRQGRARVPSELLHELIRSSGEAFATGMEQVQRGMDRFLKGSLERISPLRRVREETERLRAQLEELELSVAEMERQQSSSTGRSESS